MLLYIDKGHVQIPVQQLVRRVAAYAQIRECVHIIKKKGESIICVSNYYVSYCSGSIFINHVHAIKFKIFY